MLVNLSRARVFIGADKVTGPIQRSRATITAAMSPYAVLADDYMVLCDCTAGPIVVNLPTAIDNTRELLVQKIDGSVNAVTLDPFGTETIGGVLTNSDLDVQFETFKLNADSANYLITGSY